MSSKIYHIQATLTYLTHVMKIMNILMHIYVNKWYATYYYTLGYFYEQVHIQSLICYFKIYLYNNKNKIYVLYFGKQTNSSIITLTTEKIDGKQSMK